MKGCRIIDRFGFNVPKSGKEKSKVELFEDYMKWQYDLKNKDWLNEEHESTLTSYRPQSELLSILESNIDTYID